MNEDSPGEARPDAVGVDPGEPSAGASSPGDSDSASLARLARCLTEACEVWEHRYPESVSDRVLNRSVRELREALSRAPGAPIPLSVRDPASLLGVRRTLLDLVRAEYLRDLDPAEDEAELHLARLQRFERVREALAPQWDEQIEAALSGPRAHEMLAEIGHDLRSPLTSILFLSEVLKGAEGVRDDPQQGRQLGLIYSGALTMLNIVNNFMELVRQGEAPSDPEPTVFSLEELLQSVRHTVQPMADEKELALETALRPLGSDRRVGHPVALSRILLNLTTNALKFTEQGEVVVRIEEIEAGELEFVVSDTGPGIDAANQEAIFNVFDPAQDRAGIRFSGSGLGLVIVRRLLRTMDSELECESEVGEGTRMSFRIALPDA